MNFNINIMELLALSQGIVYWLFILSKFRNNKNKNLKIIISMYFYLNKILAFKFLNMFFCRPGQMMWGAIKKYFGIQTRQKYLVLLAIMTLAFIMSEHCVKIVGYRLKYWFVVKMVHFLQTKLKMGKFCSNSIIICFLHARSYGVYYGIMKCCVFYYTLLGWHHSSWNVSLKFSTSLQKK